MRGLQQEATRREKCLVMRLTTKESESHDYLVRFASYYLLLNQAVFAPGRSAAVYLLINSLDATVPYTRKSGFSPTYIGYRYIYIMKKLLISEN